MEKGKTILKIIGIVVGIIIVFFIGVKFTEINNSGQNSGSNKGSGSNKSISISDTELKEILQKKFDKNNPLCTIDKIEKYEEDGKGRYLYVLYDHFYDNVKKCNVNEETVYLIDCTESIEEPIINGYGADYIGVHNAATNLKNTEEYNWNK